MPILPRTARTGGGAGGAIAPPPQFSQVQVNKTHVSPPKIDTFKYYIIPSPPNRFYLQAALLPSKLGPLWLDETKISLSKHSESELERHSGFNKLTNKKAGEALISNQAL